MENPAARLRGSLLTVGLCLVFCATWPMNGRAQSFTSAGTIVFLTSNPDSSPYPSSNSVSGLSGTLTALTLTFNNFSVSNANSLAFVLQSPDGAHNLDLFSATANVTNGSTFTLSDSGPGLVPSFSSSTPVALSGSYKATDYLPGKDTFPGPGPGTNYISAGTGASGSGTGAFLTTFGLIAGSNLNGTWKLYSANQAPPASSGAIGSWTLTFTLTNAPATTTTLNPPSPNPAFTSGSNSLVTLSAQVMKADLSGPATNGSVVFHDNTLNQDIATNTVNSSGIATATFTFTNEGIHTLLATYTGGTGFAPSLPSATVTETVNNHTVVIVNGGTASFSNPGHITIPNASSNGTPYPSLIYVGTNDAPTLPGTIQHLTVTLTGLDAQDTEDLGLMLVAPNGAAYEFMSFVGNGTRFTGNLTFDDNAASRPAFGGILTTGTFQPTTYYINAGHPDTYPLPAPQTFNSAPPSGTTTLASEFGGMIPEGAWSLYLANRLSGPAATLGSWTLNFTESAPSLSVTTSHIGNFCQGQMEQYTIMVKNNGPGFSGGTVPVVVVDTLPSGLAAAGASGSGWNYASVGQVVTLTTTNPVAAGNSYPPITLMVDVSATASSPLLNSPGISGGSAGNTDSAIVNPTPSATITPSPVNPCPNSTGNQASAPAGAGSYLWTITNGTITSASNLQTITYNAGPSGKVGLTLQAGNANGCTATNSLILGDFIPPSITCSSNITVTATGYCPAIVNFTLSASDNCALASLTATPPSGSAFPVGTNTVDVVVTDAAGNSNTCSFKVTVLPGPAPQLAASFAGTNVVLAWPEAAACYTLQSTPLISTPASSNLWMTYAGPRATNSGFIRVTNSVQAASQFYRLAY